MRFRPPLSMLRAYVSIYTLHILKNILAEKTLYYEPITI